MKRRQDIVNGGDKILQLYEENKRFVPYIRSASDICDNIFSKVRIGEGSQGRVYKVKFRNDRKAYVMKTTEEGFMYLTHPEEVEEYVRGKLGDNISKVKYLILAIMDYFDLHGRVSWRRLMRFNHLTKDTDPTYDIIYNFVIPNEDVECKVSEKRSYPYNLDIEGEVIVMPGDYVCFSTVYTETVISLLLTQLPRRGICYHFINFYSSVFCEKTQSYNYFIEKMDTALDDLIEKNRKHIDDIFTPANLMSILVSIYVMSNEYSICHNDLAFRNVLVRETKKIESLRNIKTIRYIIDDTTYDFPMPQYVYKISDFGFAQKFSEPKVIDVYTLQNTKSTIPNFDTYGLYDLFLILEDYISMIEGESEALDQHMHMLIGMLFTYSLEQVRDIILHNDQNMMRDLFLDSLLNSKFELNNKVFQRMFSEYIVRTNDSNIFIAADFNGK